MLWAPTGEQSSLFHEAYGHQPFPHRAPLALACARLKLLGELSPLSAGQHLNQMQILQHEIATALVPLHQRDHYALDQLTNEAVIRQSQCTPQTHQAANILLSGNPANEIYERLHLGRKVGSMKLDGVK